MSERPRFAPSVLLTLTLVLLPGLALAGDRRAPTPADGESPLSFLLDWAARGWESLTGRSPAPVDPVLRRCGPWIDPNGVDCA